MEIFEIYLTDLTKEAREDLYKLMDIDDDDFDPDIPIAIIKKEDLE